MNGYGNGNRPISSHTRKAQRCLLNCARAFALVLIAVLISQVANANIFSNDRRHDLSSVPTVLQPVGILRTAANPESWGTAFLVGQCHIATAFHVAFPGHKSPDFKPSTEAQAVFHVGKSEGQLRDQFLAKTKAHPVAWGDFHTRDFSGLSGDWAILELESCLGRHYGWVQIEKPASMGVDSRADAVSLATYPIDRRDRPGMTFESNCRVRETVAPGLSAMDCALIEGGSGGPVLEYYEGATVESSGYSLVGIAIRRLTPVDEVLPEYDVAHANIMVMSDVFAAAVKRLTGLASDLKWRLIPQKVQSP